jgi:hypothetical protein
LARLRVTERSERKDGLSAAQDLSARNCVQTSTERQSAQKTARVARAPRRERARA